VLGWLFVKGQTSPSADGRTAVHLAPAERDFVLTEMRQLLQAVHGIVTGVSQLDQAQGRSQAAAAARSAGMVMAVDDNPTLMLRLPLPMKQLGMSVHRDFDELAEAITDGATPQQILERLSTITTRCLACHEMYQLKEG
jgi:cytochrome c556